MQTFAQKKSQPRKAVVSNIVRPPNMATRGPAHSEHPTLRLQSPIGNAAGQRMSQTDAEGFKSEVTSTALPHSRQNFCRIPIHSPAAGAIQTKLVINQPGDEYEREADHISQQVMRMPESPSQDTWGRSPSDFQTWQSRQGNEHLHTKLVRSGDGGQLEAPPIVHEVLRSPGPPLDVATSALMEPRFGHDFSRVRIHADAKAAESAQAIGARAYTVGRDIVFGAGQYAPRTSAGQRLLAHELTHVLQQNGRAVSLQREDAESQEREKWQQNLKGKGLPTARQISDEKDTAFFVEGLIETSNRLQPYLKGKLAKTSVARNFHIYGSREEFDAKASKLVGGESSPGTKFGGFYHRRTDSIHLPPRAAFGHALHEGIHKYSSPAVLNVFGQFLNEGVTQYFADSVQEEHKVEGKTQHEYGEQLECAKIAMSFLKDSEKTLAEAYFQGKATPMAQEINARLGIDHGERVKLVSTNQLCERIKQKGRSN